VAFTSRTKTASASITFDGNVDDGGETHFEWLARIVLEEDRRRTPFTYGNKDAGERRRWDLKASLFSTERTRRLQLRGG
jgi:hypothetical protein